ncbi:hypothetical protein LEP1GSC170_5265 [Leptospira interrogans serovar Bataviae str. HAI135]|nr:hypothetical protein LEP1GSC170_5265 [Leptospira interrogans serovar Bataviae str. HAI135]
MEKIYVYSSESLEEYLCSNLSSIELEVELFNRDKSEEKKKKSTKEFHFLRKVLNLNVGN